MRTITVIRRKRLAAAPFPMYVYMEDPAGGDGAVNGKPVRCLGTVKNGENGSFSVPESELTLYVMPDKPGTKKKLGWLSFTEWVKIPAGEEPVTVAGENLARFSAGNPFHFDENSTPDVFEECGAFGRRRGMILLACMIALFLAVYGLVRLIGPGEAEVTPAADRVFNDTAFTVTLTEDFREESVSGSDFQRIYLSDRVFLQVSKQWSKQFKKNTTPAEYAKMVITNMGQELPVLEQDGLIYFEDETTDADGYYYHRFHFVWLHDEYFYLFTFTTAAQKADALRNDVFRYAGSVTWKG